MGPIGLVTASDVAEPARPPLVQVRGPGDRVYDSVFHLPASYAAPDASEAVSAACGSDSATDLPRVPSSRHACSSMRRFARWRVAGRRGTVRCCSDPRPGSLGCAASCRLTCAEATSRVEQRSALPNVFESHPGVTRGSSFRLTYGRCVSLRQSSSRPWSSSRSSLSLSRSSPVNVAAACPGRGGARRAR